MKLTSSRQQTLLDMLDADGELHVAALAERLQVSQETIRRDLSDLEARGALKRVHGGAISLSSPRLRTLSERGGVKEAEKAAIGRLAAGLVRDNETVFVGEGTTALAFAKSVVNRVAARFTTNMIDIAQTLVVDRRSEVSLTGGVLDAEHNLLTGFGTIRSVQQRYFDAVIIGTSGIHESLGFMDYRDDYAALYQTLLGRTKRFIVLADHSKFGKGPPVCTFPLNSVQTVVTDRMPSAVFQEAFAAASVELLIPQGSTALQDNALQDKVTARPETSNEPSHEN